MKPMDFYVRKEGKNMYEVCHQLPLITCGYLNFTQQLLYIEIALLNGLNRSKNRLINHQVILVLSYAIYHVQLYSTMSRTMGHAAMFLSGQDGYPQTK